MQGETFVLPFRQLMLASLLLALTSYSLADDWPQWLGPQRDGVWRESGLIEKFPEGGPTIRWRTPLGIGYSGPAVAGDGVYVLDLQREVDENGQPRRARARAYSAPRGCCASTPPVASCNGAANTIAPTPSLTPVDRGRRRWSRAIVSTR